MPTKIIDFWNRQPHLRRHTDTNSKIYRNSIEMLNDLLGGNFKEKYPLNDMCIEINDITTEDLEREWSQEEIEEAIERFNYMMSPEYIADKKYFPKNLQDFIYNFRTEHSFIFSVLGNREVFGRPIKPLEEEIVKLYQKTFFKYELSENDQNKLVKNVNYLVLQQQDFEQRVGQFCFFHPLKEKSFFKIHIEYIQSVYEGKANFSFNHLGAFTFQGFLEWLREKRGIEFYPSKKELFEMKEKFEKDKIELEKVNLEFNEILKRRKKWACSRGLNRFHRQQG